MIQSNPSTILNINKFSVLLASVLLLFLWMTLDVKEYDQSRSDKANHTLNDSKYTKTTSFNPFLRVDKNSDKDILTDDFLPTVTTLQSEVPPFTSLNLKLHGIVYQSKQNSYAMISMDGAIQEIISENDKISDGLFAVEIKKSQVTVNYFGDLYTLHIENTRQYQGTELSNATDNQLNFNQQIELIEVDKHRNPIRLFMIRRPYAVYENGEFQGYKIMPGSNADQFKRLGFKSGDIITYLNGIEFTGPGMKEYVIQQLTHAMHIDLTVMRDNQVLNINYGF